MPSLFESSLFPKLTPGDVFPADWDDDLPDSLGPVVVFSHGCEIDKPHDIVQVARITYQQDTSPGDWNQIMAGDVAHAIWLEGCTTPGWVNLRTFQRAPKHRLVQRLDRRLHSMTPDGRVFLAVRFFAFLTRISPDPAAIAAMIQATAAQSQD